jgi:hypothetical protein
MVMSEFIKISKRESLMRVLPILRALLEASCVARFSLLLTCFSLLPILCPLHLSKKEERIGKDSRKDFEELHMKEG